MNKRLLIMTVLMVCMMLPSAVYAQFAKLERHPNMPKQYEAAFIDHVHGFAASVFKSAYGQYFGQITTKGDIYGYGTFFTDRDGEVYGQFRNGNFICGIKMGSTTVKVGTDEHYAVYNLLSGDMDYILKDGEKYLPDAEHKKSWKYLQMTYGNGDKYVGETVDGKRDGYGIYYYADGNFYVGRYADGNPVGFGALFRTDNRVVIQGWDER